MTLGHTVIFFFGGGELEEGKSGSVLVWKVLGILCYEGGDLLKKFVRPVKFLTPQKHS